MGKEHTRKYTQRKSEELDRANSYGCRETRVSNFWINSDTGFEIESEIVNDKRRSERAFHSVIASGMLELSRNRRFVGVIDRCYHFDRCRD